MSQYELKGFKVTKSLHEVTLNIYIYILYTQDFTAAFTIIYSIAANIYLFKINNRNT